MDYKISFNAPEVIFRCPVCENPFLESSIASSNSFGETLYSDGSRRDGYILSSTGNWITKCPKCSNHFHKKYLRKGTNLFKGKSKDWWDENCDSPEYSEYGTCDSSGYVYDIFFWQDAIDKKLFFPKRASKHDQKIYNMQLHLELWRCFNWILEDIIKGNSYTQEQKEYLQKNYIDSCKIFISKIEPYNDNNKLILTELYRNIGDFENSLKTLNLVEDKKLCGNVIKEMKQKIDDNYTYAFEIKNPMVNITEADYLSWLKSRYKQNTAHKYLQIIKKVFRENDTTWNMSMMDYGRAYNTYSNKIVDEYVKKLIIEKKYLSYLRALNTYNQFKQEINTGFNDLLCCVRVK